MLFAEDVRNAVASSASAAVLAIWEGRHVLVAAGGSLSDLSPGVSIWPPCPMRVLFALLIVSPFPTLQPGMVSSVDFFQPRRFEVPALITSSLGAGFCDKLLDLLVKELAILATLSFLMTVDAEVRTKFSLRARVVMPGNGRISRLQTSARNTSSRARSLRAGASTGIRALVVSRDCERWMADDVDELFAASRTTLVFFNTTWHNGTFGPIVVARWMDIRRVTVPVRLSACSLR